MNAALTLSGGDTGESLGQLRLENNSIYAGNITLAGDISGAGDGFFNGGIITGNIGESGGCAPCQKSPPPPWLFQEPTPTAARPPSWRAH
ncbi:hypothetical protein [Verrucomicrobium spinosum]|uniref:hypothetical protein n=1 Tax=Verrucomicrobium spinosum TaxID=2736 RepID=UPI000A5E502C|nr:hypothetical protein [Verrucomicrobium spinosum]